MAIACVAACLSQPGEESEVTVEDIQKDIIARQERSFAIETYETITDYNYKFVQIMDFDTKVLKTNINTRIKVVGNGHFDLTTNNSFLHFTISSTGGTTVSVSSYVVDGVLYSNMYGSWTKEKLPEERVDYMDIMGALVDFMNSSKVSLKGKSSKRSLIYVLIDKEEHVEFLKTFGVSGGISQLSDITNETGAYVTNSSFLNEISEEGYINKIESLLEMDVSGITVSVKTDIDFHHFNTLKPMSLPNDAKNAVDLTSELISPDY